MVTRRVFIARLFLHVAGRHDLATAVFQNSLGNPGISINDYVPEDVSLIREAFRLGHEQDPNGTPELIF